MTQADSTNSRSLGFVLLAAATGVLLALTLYWGFIVAPVELQMGIVYKIFFFHAPSAYAAAPDGPKRSTRS